MHLDEKKCKLGLSREVNFYLQDMQAAKKNLSGRPCKGLLLMVLNAIGSCSILGLVWIKNFGLPRLGQCVQRPRQ